MYFDEDVVLDARLNILNDKIDKFIIIESKYTHSGKEKKPQFDIKKFQQFEKKIIYLICDHLPPKLEKLTNNKDLNDQIKIRNALKIENYQRNYILKGLTIGGCDSEDLVIISDIDEIPNLENINNLNFDKNLIFFNQRLFYYRFNLEDIHMKWIGSKMCKFKKLISPQWLRNTKSRRYSIWRLDAFFSNKKYSNISIVEDGGWHFTYIKKAEGIKRKLENYLHHVEFEINPLTINDIENMIDQKKIVYDQALDKTIINKFQSGKILKTVNLNTLPDYFSKNKIKLSDWLDFN
jgi:beta-1,4-mannosyl-glycoprotein beta-1,4-N-acetylglucosaminyltransferase